MKFNLALVLLSAASTQASGQNNFLRTVSNVDQENDVRLNAMSTHRLMKSVKAKISIEKTVKEGQDAECSATAEAGWGELLVGPVNYDITYCYKVSNVGTTTLCSVKVTDAVGDGYNEELGCIAPGESVYGPPHKSVIPEELERTMATAKGTPVDVELSDVSAEDDAGVDPKETGITIAKTVTKGETGKCQGYAGSEKIHEILFGKAGDSVTYCYYVTNTGTALLCGIVVSDEDEEYVESLDCLKPGESKYTPERRATIPEGGEYMYAKVDSHPFTEKGIPILTFPHVTATDGAGVSVYDGKVKINTRVKTGMDGVTCSEDTKGEAMDALKAETGDIFTYCYEVINTGPTTLCNILVIDEVNQYSENLEGCLGPNESKFAPKNPSYVCEPGDEKNEATVSATPSTTDGAPIEDLTDVTASDSADVIYVPCPLKPKAPIFEKAKIICAPSPGWPNDIGADGKGPMRPSKCLPKAK